MPEKQIHTSIVNFHNLSLRSAAAMLQELSQQAQFSYVVTPNIDHLARLCGLPEDNEIHDVYKQASLTLCDSRIIGKIVLWGARQSLSVVPGSDLTRYLFDEQFAPEDKLLLIGCENAQVDTLRSQYPHLAIDHINPSMGFIDKDDEVRSLIQQITEKQANYILLAVGSPRQELLAYKLKASGLGRGVALCIGASINFITGAESRAPLWLQRLHLEWFYRMLKDPKRLVKRYSLNALSLPTVISRLLK